jgi:predicted Fe-Mo cluster-binding NifX family protein
MKLAIPIWEGKVSPVFDTASRLLVLQLEEKEETSRFETPLEPEDLPKKCYRIKGLGVDILICGAISRPFYTMLVSSGTNVIPWISGPAEDVLEAYLKGKLFSAKFLMPGCQRELETFEGISKRE